ncbi:MAG: hypothetical protein COU25_00410, partial [Candidatus Levybacteria bacterium CG10_big_fil_rev_8_21_14_0_10_35_13]
LTRTVILARLLLPSQFGIYGIGLLVLSMLEILTETGINVFLVQQKGNIDRYINSAWIISIFRGIAIMFIMVATTPIIIRFFNSPDALSILLLFSIIPFIRGFINPSIAKLQKELRFDKEFWFRLSVLSLNTAIAVAFAYYTRSVTSLAFGLIAAAILEIILSFVITSPKPALKLNKNHLFLIFHKGKWITLSGVFSYMYHNVDNIVVAKLLGTTSLGLYEMAYNIAMIPITGISDVISRVTFPVYTLISGDKQRLRKAFIKTMVFISIASVVFGAILFLFTEQLVMVILGERWIGIVDVLKILIIFGVIRGISGSSSALFLAVKKQKYVTFVTLVSIIGLAVTIIPLVLNFGIYGAGISALIGSLAALPFMFYFTFKIIK